MRALGGQSGKRAALKSYTSRKGQRADTPWGRGWQHAHRWKKHSHQMGGRVARRQAGQQGPGLGGACAGASAHTAGRGRGWKEA